MNFMKRLAKNALAIITVLAVIYACSEPISGRLDAAWFAGESIAFAVICACSALYKRLK